MTLWIKNMTSTICIVTILLHLLPSGKYARYVRFYAGIVLCIVAARPIFHLLFGKGELERVLKAEFAKETWSEMESSVSGIEELKNQTIQDAYQEELRRQVRDISVSYGVSPNEVRLVFDEKETYRLEQIILICREQNPEKEMMETLRRELSEIFSPEDILILNEISGTG